MGEIAVISDELGEVDELIDLFGEGLEGLFADVEDGELFEVNDALWKMDE